MSIEPFSVMVQCWLDPQTGLTQVRATRVDVAEKVQLNSGIFLLRITSDESASFQRCLVRHIESGRETFIQGGPGLRDFVKVCLLGLPENTDQQ
jgi:hypothetical protein